MDNELKEFFEFLSGDSHEVKKNDLIFGLENYALNLGEEVVKRIQEDVEKHKSNTLNFEDFRNLWKHNMERNLYSTRETAEQIFNLILDTVYTNPLELKDKINADAIKKALNLLKVNWKANKALKYADIDQLVNDMISAIDLDGDGQISLADFEFMMKFFNESKTGVMGNQTGNAITIKK